MGFCEGFDPGISELPQLTTECRNNRSARFQPSVVDELIETEVNIGYF